MEDVLKPIKDKSIKWLFVLFAVFALVAVFFFMALVKARADKENIIVPLVGGVVGAILALVCGLLASARFLRRRSIAGGLFITTTVATVVYAVASQFVATPRGHGLVTHAATATGVTPIAGAANDPLWAPIILAQVGLFALWFLFILFTIYVYVRPIRRIDQLLTQIMDGKEVKKLRVGKSSQYKQIECKLQALAEEKYQHERKRQDRLAKSRARATSKKQLMQEFLAEKEKLTPKE